MTTSRDGLTSGFHTLPRVFVSADLDEGVRVGLDAGQAHHLRTVLRCADGQGIRLFNGRDGEWLATLTLQGKREVAASLTKRLCPQPVALPVLHLFFAPLPKDRMDILVEKAVELGVGALHPVLTERTGVRSVNMERLRRQVIEAAEQSERLDVPALFDPGPCLHVLEKTGFLVLACLERGDHPPLPCGEGVKAETGVLVGPEGGFSLSERAALLRLPNVRPVSLGPRILRAETAALYVLSRLSPSGPA